MQGDTTLTMYMPFTHAHTYTHDSQSTTAEYCEKDESRVLLLNSETSIRRYHTQFV